MKRKLFIFIMLFVLMTGFAIQTVSASAAQQSFAVPRLVVNTSFLNVRSGDGPQYSVLGVVVGGTELPALGKNGSGSWFLVASPFGAGWVDISFTIPRGDFTNVPTIEPEPAVVTPVSTPVSIALLTAQSVTPPVAVLDPGVVIVNTSFQNIRLGSGPQYEILAVVPGGTTLQVIGRTNDTSWYKVAGDFGQGWIFSEFVIYRGTFSNIPILYSPL